MFALLPKFIHRHLDMHRNEMCTLRRPLARVAQHKQVNASFRGRLGEERTLQWRACSVEGSFTLREVE